MRLKIKGQANARLTGALGRATLSIGNEKKIGLKYSECDESEPEIEDDEFTEIIISRREHTHGNYVWRYRGLFAGRHVVAKALFDYPDDVTNDEIYFMEDVVGLIEGVIDGILWSASENERISRKNVEEAKARIEKIRLEKMQAEAKQMIQSQRELMEADHLYLMRHANGLTKIGRSVNPKAREKTLQAEDPRLELIFTAENLGWLERKFHQMLKDERVRGEWFRLDEHRIDWIKFYCERKAESESMAN